MNIRAIASVLCLVCCIAQASGAQADDPGARLSISVLVTPQVAYPGSSVKVTGKTLALGKSPTVHIAFVLDTRAEHNDRAHDISGTADVDSAGKYAVKTRIDQPGIYRVLVTAPDGKGVDSTTYTLLDPPDVADEVVNGVDKLVTGGMDKLVRTVRAEALSLPANPAKIAADEKLAAVDKQIQDWPAQSAKLKKAIEKFQSIVIRYPASAALFQPQMEKIAEISGELPAEQARIDGELARSKAQGVTCERIESLIESLKVISAAANFLQQSIGDIGLAFGIDLTSDRFAKKFTPPSLQENAGYALALTEGSKFLQTTMAGPEAFPVALGVLVTDVSVYMQQKNFEKYCEKLEGPMSATMHAEIFQGKAPWWTYDMTLKGRLILRYAKNGSPGSAVHVTGEFVGTATKLGVWEDALAVLYPVTRKTSTMLRKLVVPPGQPFSDLEGKTIAASSPFGFFIPVEGDLVGSKLTLHLLDARTDISDLVEAQVTYVLVGPMILAPIIVKYDLPFTKAHKLLFRAMNDGPLELPVVVSRNAMGIERTVRRTRPGDGNSVDYTLNIRACNPGCE